MPKLLTGFVIALVAGCSSQAVSSAGPTAGSPAATAASTAPATPPPLPTDASPSASPVITPGPTEPIGTLDVIPPGAAVQVTVAELNLRVEPSTSAKKVETLSKGDILITLPYDSLSWGFGPRNANGYVWYPVVKTQVEGSDSQLPPLPTRPVIFGTEIVAGWVATHDGSKPFVEQLQPRCPTTVDLRNVEAMLAAERLACFEGSIVLEGTFGCGGCGGATTLVTKPEWLANGLEFAFLSLDASTQLGPLVLHFSPDGPARPADGTIIRATTHIDDPASTTCSMHWADVPKGDPGRVVPPATAVLTCRERLVVDSYEKLGTDPDFPG